VLVRATLCKSCQYTSVRQVVSDVTRGSTRANACVNPAATPNYVRYYLRLMHARPSGTTNPKLTYHMNSYSEFHQMLLSCDTGPNVVESGVVHGSCSASRDDVQTAIAITKATRPMARRYVQALTSTTPPVCQRSRTVLYRSLSFYSSIP
jgi:hypothetical protein